MRNEHLWRQFQPVCYCDRFRPNLVFQFCERSANHLINLRNSFFQNQKNYLLYYNEKWTPTLLSISIVVFVVQNERHWYSLSISRWSVCIYDFIMNFEPQRCLKRKVIIRPSSLNDILLYSAFRVVMVPKITSKHLWVMQRLSVHHWHQMVLKKTFFFWHKLF